MPPPPRVFVLVPSCLWTHVEDERRPSSGLEPLVLEEGADSHEVQQDDMGLYSCFGWEWWVIWREESVWDLNGRWGILTC